MKAKKMQKKDLKPWDRYVYAEMFEHKVSFGWEDLRVRGKAPLSSFNHPDTWVYRITFKEDEK